MKKLLKILPYLLAYLPLAILNFFYAGVLGVLEYLEDSNREIKTTWRTGKTWKERW